MKQRFIGLAWIGFFLCGLPSDSRGADVTQSAGVRKGFCRPEGNSFPDLFVWTDTCNVYVLRDGDAATLIDLGDGSVLDHLSDIAVHRVEWVLFTHHHREQCQGAPRLKETGAKLAGPETERD